MKLNTIMAKMLRVKKFNVYMKMADIDSDREAPADIDIYRITCSNLDQNHRTFEKILEVDEGNQDYILDVRKGNACGVLLLQEDRLVHYGFVLLKNKTKNILGLKEGDALIGNSFTVPAFRGKGYQALSALERISLAHEHGFDRVFSETAPDNIASQKGLKKAGFVFSYKLTCVIILNTIIVRTTKPDSIPRISLQRPF